MGLKRPATIRSRLRLTVGIVRSPVMGLKQIKALSGLAKDGRRNCQKPGDGIETIRPAASIGWTDTSELSEAR